MSWFLIDFDNNNEIVKMIKKVYISSLWVHIQHFKEIMLINLNIDITTILLYNMI